MATWIFLETGPSHWTRVLLLLSAASVIRVVSAALPQFDNAPYVATLYERENTQKTLVTFNCTDPDGDTPVVSMATGGVSPASPCGNCFSVLPCAPDYCLIFSPVGTLDRHSDYKITVECTANTDTVNAVVDLRLTRNNPPTFVPNQLVATKTITNTKTRSAGYQIYDVDATDPNTDAIIFTMSSDPPSDNFEIGAGDGIIRAKNDLVSECRNSITFYVNITDNINNPVGPLAIHVTLNGANEAPDITNLDVSLQVPEDTAVGDVIRAIVATDDDNVNKLTYTLTANPSSNRAFFEIAGSDLKVKSTLDYEVVADRKTNLTVVASDGACTSQGHYVYVTVTDVNEAPDLQPKNAAYTVYEGSDFGPSLTIPWVVTDPDYSDSVTYSIIDGNDKNFFSINPTTGQLSVNGDYDIDNGANPTTQTLRVKVTDKGGLSDNTTVTLLFKDRNDNYPVITAGSYDYSVCETKRVGATLGTLTCTDQDSSFQGNNITYFGTVSSGGLTVLASGAIVMSSRPAVGQTFTTSVYCYDRGTYPGPLRSQSPMPVSVTGVECPTTIPPTPAPVVTVAATVAATTTPTTTIASTSPSNWFNRNLPWIVVAALLATALLALLLYMAYLYCSPCLARICRQPCCKQRPPKPRKPLTPPPKRITPVEEPPREPTPPPAVVGSPYLYDFWKERYPDDDYGHQPNRKANPRPMTPDGAQSGSGNAENGGPGPQPKTKSRWCTIL